MREDVLVSVKAKTDFFKEYFDIPGEAVPEYKRFVSDVYELGERSGSPQQFESDFVSTGLGERFNSLIAKCRPKARAMTAEERAESKRLTKEMLRDKSTAKHITDTVLDSAKTDARGALHRITRQKMINDGTFRDYTVASNRVDTARQIGGFIKGRFGKKKDRGDEE